MNKEFLIKTAEKLSQPSAAAATEFSEKAEGMAVLINNRFKKRSDLNMLIGEGNLDMMMDNHRNHMRFLTSVFKHFEPEVLVETVLWVFRAYRSHGFKLTYWPAQLDAWVEIFKTELSPSAYAEIYPFYDWMIIHNPIFAKVSDELLSGPPEFKH
ncbi:MAG: hypothetical protein KG029_07405 [Bacteroidetes bacterium]|jgi:hypothetical protein|nr:hypothetical protein [Bacteroidota bacterium]